MPPPPSSKVRASPLRDRNLRSQLLTSLSLVTAPGSHSNPGFATVFAQCNKIVHPRACVFRGRPRVLIFKLQSYHVITTYSEHWYVDKPHGVIFPVLHRSLRIKFGALWNSCEAQSEKVGIKKSNSKRYQCTSWITLDRDRQLAITISHGCTPLWRPLPHLSWRSLRVVDSWSTPHHLTRATAWQQLRSQKKKSTSHSRFFRIVITSDFPDMRMHLHSFHFHFIFHIRDKGFEKKGGGGVGKCLHTIACTNGIFEHNTSMSKLSPLQTHLRSGNACVHGAA